MEYAFVIAVAVFGLLVAADQAFRGGPDDPNWELRWRGLDPGYQDWLAAMTTSASWRKTLDDPQEIELADGFARRERRRRAYVLLASAALLAFATALFLAGLVPFPVASMGLAVYGIVQGLTEFICNRQIRRRLAQRSNSEAAPPRPGAAPA